MTSDQGITEFVWERVLSNGWWRVYVATRRDEYGTPEDENGDCRMGAGPTREEAMAALLRVLAHGL